MGEVRAGASIAAALWLVACAEAEPGAALLRPEPERRDADAPTAAGIGGGRDGAPRGGAPDAGAARPEAGSPSTVEAPRANVAKAGCTPGTTSTDPCPRAGVCAEARATCRPDGSWGPCVFPETYQNVETRCDGLDNDCDGRTDEPFRRKGAPCDGEDPDRCARGHYVCNAAGTWIECVEDEPTTVEICNGADDDCDGETDEDLDPPLAERQDGICAGTRKVCSGVGGWIEPDYRSVPGYEVYEISCNGLDDDCDGEVDDGLFAPPADRHVGVCRGATKVCAGEQGWHEPSYTHLVDFEAEETLCDGVDNDCDGAIDETVEPPPCRLFEGVCADPAGPGTCLGVGGFSRCDYGPYYQVRERDTCDALDNDCDGEIDEGPPCPPWKRLVRVRPGRYLQGSRGDSFAHEDDERRREVILTRPLLVRATEVTQGEWQAVTGANPSRFVAADRPVERVSWFDAVRFLNALSADDGLPLCYEIDGETVRWPDGLDCPGWRLPTEAEWEYFARAGTQGLRWFDEAGVDVRRAAWFAENSGGETWPVARLRSNPFDLYDVHGNVAEWVWDRYGRYPLGPVTDPVGPEVGRNRVARGGSFASANWQLRAADREPHEPDTHSETIGLRPVRTAPDSILR